MSAGWPERQAPRLIPPLLLPPTHLHQEFEAGRHPRQWQEGGGRPWGSRAGRGEDREAGRRGRYVGGHWRRPGPRVQGRLRVPRGHRVGWWG